MIHDDTEREHPRVSDSELQKDFYSEKKKNHTVKNTVITCLSEFILFCRSHCREENARQENRRHPILVSL